MDVLATKFGEYAARKLEDHLAQISRCVGMLSIEQLWYRPNARSNSVGNLLLHLTGNIRQWILGGIAGEAIERDRQAEFDHRTPLPADHALGPLQSTIAEACRAILKMTEVELSNPYRIQDYEVAGVAAVMHVVEHLAFHTGQIVTTTKWLLDCDLSLYDEKGHRRDGRKDDVP
jgi:uncharacterized damage-inducible protein DinB